MGMMEAVIEIPAEDAGNVFEMCIRDRARRNKTMVVSGFNFIFNHIRSIVA